MICGLFAIQLLRQNFENLTDFFCRFGAISAPTRDPTRDPLWPLHSKHYFRNRRPRQKCHPVRPGRGAGTRRVEDRTSMLKGTVHRPVGLAERPLTQNVYIFV